MIVNAHPILTALNEAPFTFYLIGSRYVGASNDSSDYDFLGVAEGAIEWGRLRSWLVEHGFKTQGQYGPDHRLYSDVWTWSGDGHPGVDVLPVTRSEADLRLRWFESMKAVGDVSGLIAKGLKAERAWPLLWDVLAKFEEGRES